MTEVALRTMNEITSTWVEDGFPNYQVWWFKLRDDDAASSELVALGLIESIGIWRSYKLTREGQYWALQNRAVRLRARAAPHSRAARGSGWSLVS